MTDDLLTHDEELVLETLKDYKKPVGEDQYHMIHQAMDMSGCGIGFEYELKYWAQVDERFKSNFGAVPYSSRLHGIIESLIEKKLIKRDFQNPLIIKYCGE